MQPIEVLIIDDEADFTDIVTDRLCSWGFAATSVADGEDALEAILGKSPDVVVLSLRDPFGRGLETLRLIRDHAPGLAVLLLLGKGMATVGMEGMRLGALDCLPQPLELGLLIKKIRQAHCPGHESDSLSGGLALLLPWILQLAVEEMSVCYWSGVQMLISIGPVI